MERIITSGNKKTLESTEVVSLDLSAAIKAQRIKYQSLLGQQREIDDPYLNQEKAQNLAKQIRNTLEEIKRLERLEKQKVRAEKLKIQAEEQAEIDNEYNELLAWMPSVESIQQNLPTVAKTLIANENTPHRNIAIFRLLAVLAVNDYRQDNELQIEIEKLEKFYKLIENNYNYSPKANQVEIKNSAISIARLQKPDLNKLNSIKLIVNTLVAKINTELNQGRVIHLFIDENCNTSGDFAISSEQISQPIRVRITSESQYYLVEKTQEGILIKKIYYSTRDPNYSDSEFIASLQSGDKILVGNDYDSIEKEVNDPNSDYTYGSVNTKKDISDKHITITYTQEGELTIRNHSTNGTTLAIPYK